MGDQHAVFVFVKGRTKKKKTPRTHLLDTDIKGGGVTFLAEGLSGVKVFGGGAFSCVGEN